MATAPTTALDNTDEHSTTALYRAAIGDVNSAYYLPLFTRFEAADRAGLSWNWSAALYTLNWLAFRQLWHAALLYSGCVVALALSVFGIGRLVFQFSEGMQWGLLATLLVIAVAVPGLGGNALLHNATRKRMQAALAASATVPEACTLLARQASTRRRLIVLAVLNLLIAGTAAYSWTHFSGFEPLPGYADKATDKLADARNLAVGRATDATAPAASAPASSVAPPAALPASAPASAAVATPAIAASAPKPVASAPVAAPMPTPAPTKAVATKPAEVKPAEVKPAAAPKPAASRPVRAKAKPAAPPPAATEALTPSPRAAPSGRFIVNVGIFADENNARNAFTRLMDADLPANSKAFRALRGPRTRVWVGPFETQTEADIAAEKIRTFGLDALVAPE
ncbi:SPOR domain-containing protein [Rhodoferax saidenbachensis]|uniref:Cell division septation protein DedD n=1 Tax=Rhodoferax saidenbachensis TaxID=1484693 RepID=A0ABU1ZGW8_9BURK|nr:SPOR domain-containing protein [Rhodoferax saidenbachensis]MDR7304792.1 cell division septation protein DedD [Rhodoferax saidenbachensis]